MSSERLGTLPECATVQFNLWMVIHSSTSCSEGVICITEPRLTHVAPGAGHHQIPHCVFHLLDTDGALSSGQDFIWYQIPGDLQAS